MEIEEINLLKDDLKALKKYIKYKEDNEVDIPDFIMDPEYREQLIQEDRYIRKYRTFDFSDVKYIALINFSLN